MVERWVGWGVRENENGIGGEGGDKKRVERDCRGMSGVVGVGGGGVEVDLGGGGKGWGKGDQECWSAARVLSGGMSEG